MTKVICFEGIDGSGKTTQIELLGATLRDQGLTVHVSSYPVYDSFFGKELGRLLSSHNETSAANVDPQSMALWYAIDRWLDYQNHAPRFQQSDFVLLNRYTLSSIVYQTLRSDINDVLASWIETLEHDVFGLPRPDLYIVMDLPPHLGNSNVLKKGVRQYIDNEPDVYERDSVLQSRVRKRYQELAISMPNAKILPCFRNDSLLPPAVIAAEVRELLHTTGIL